MYLRIRKTLPMLTGLLWLYLMWRFLLGAPSLSEAGQLVLTGQLVGTYGDLTIFFWVASMFLAMIAADRLWCAFVSDRIGVDPKAMHWSKLRRRDGFLFCAQCQSSAFLPPDDFAEDSLASCADCGHIIGPFGEVKRASNISPLRMLSPFNRP